MATLLIKAEDITKNTPMGGNIDVNKYLFVIKDSQQFVIKPILGTKLYDKIITDYEGDTLAGDYLILVNDYIKPILVASVFAEFIPVHAFMISNGGISKFAPENSQPATKNEVDYLAQTQRNKASVYIERLEKFLCDTDLPEYTCNQDNDYDVKPHRNINYMGGWDI